MSPSTPDRRTLLRALAAASALSLAGCSSDDGMTAPETTTSGETPEPDTPAGTETPDDGTPSDPDEVDPEVLKSAARTLIARWANEEYEAMRESVRFEEYPGLDHLFMPGEGPSRPADYYEQDNVAESVVTDLAGWIDGVADDTGSE